MNIDRTKWRKPLGVFHVIESGKWLVDCGLKDLSSVYALRSTLGL
jgi:hypothetical protein